MRTKQDSVEQLCYFSKAFDIETRWTGGNNFVIEVTNPFYDLIERKEVKDDDPDLKKVDKEFEALKTKYILDYEHKVS